MSNNGLKLLNEINLVKCRLCQDNDGSIEFLTNPTLLNRIIFCTKINIENTNKNEQLPKKICTKCDQILADYMIFQENCLKIDEQLNKLLSDTKQTEKRKLSKRTLILNRKKRVLLDRICKKCKEPKKSNRHCCKIKKIDEIKEENVESENILIKTESEILENTKEVTDSVPNLESGVSYILVISDENKIKNEVTIVEEAQVEVIDEKSEEICEDDLKYEILEEIPYQSEDASSDSNCSEDDFKQRIKKIRKTKDSNGTRNYVCNVIDCGKVYSTKGGLKKHKYAEHNIRDFLCTTCGKHFGEHSGLKVHERIHAATKPYSCTKCNIGFVQAANLRTHIKLHHEGHRYYCTQCGKGFLTSCTLKRHELVHIGKKDFKCEMCSSEFYTRRELLKHKKYHFDIRSHFCNICYKSFVEKHHLTIHMRSHTGERPYVCDVNGCTKSFMDSQKLRRHKKNVHRLNQMQMD